MLKCGEDILLSFSLRHHVDCGVIKTKPWKRKINTWNWSQIFQFEHCNCYHYGGRERFTGQIIPLPSSSPERAATATMSSTR